MAQVYAAQELILSVPQIEVRTEHLFHAGMYARTLYLPAAVMISGALVRVATVLIVQGDCAVLSGDGWHDLTGYNVLPGQAGRKQLFVTRSPVSMTMLFPTGAQTVEQAEQEFTDECENLMSRRSGSDTVTVTGE